ncbi:LCP family protein [Rossellomorea vietnamensis]|uniref:LCP family protein n=1 Tax=Rossellomorea vietnamensis TaxID=218284 RepID=UPI003CEB400E
MEDKELEKSLKKFHNADLKFTHEDREKVFQKIENHHNQKSKLLLSNLSRRAAPLMAAAVLLTLSIILAYSLIGDESNQASDQANQEAATELNDATTLLLLLEGQDNRTDLHLLMSYSKSNGSINLISLPSDMYVPVIPAGEGEPDMEKLTNIHAYRGGGESVKKSISKALDLKIDHYVTLEENDFANLLNTIGETNFKLNEKKSLFSFDGSQIELPKGTNYLDGEEAASLLTISTVTNGNGTNWTEQDKLDLSRSVMVNMLSHVKPESVGSLLGDTDSSPDLTTILTGLASTKMNTMRTISIEEQLESVLKGENYFLQFKEGSAEEIKSKLINFE